MAGRLSIAPRLALRDLARYQARSGAALAAVTLALGIAATVVVIASAEEAKAAAEPPSLSDRQIRVYLGPSEERTLTPVDAPAQLDRLAAGARQLAAQLDRATLIPLRKAVEPGAVRRSVVGDTRLFPTIELTTIDSGPREEATAAESQLYRRHACGARVPRDRPGHGRSEHRLPRRPQRRDRRARHPELDAAGREFAVTNVQRIDVGRHLFGAEQRPERRRPSSRSTVFAATAGSRFRPAGSSSRAGP